MELAEVVGSLTVLQRFPVEPLAGESPNVAPVRGSGLLGDRVYGIQDAATGEVLTAATSPLLLFYGARYLDDLVAEDMDAWTRVRDPAGVESPITDPGWRQELGRMLGREIALVPRTASGLGGPLRLVSRPTLRLAERTYGAPIEPIRVRANLVIDIPDGKAFDEDAWANRSLRIGDALLEVTGSADDAFVASFRPEIGRGDTDMLESLLKIRGGRFGLCVRVVSGHRIRVGDPVSISD